MHTKLGFSLIELTVTIAIASILAAVGISGYMQTLMVSRRKEATIGLQRAMLMLSSSINTACPYGTNITTDSISTNCLTALSSTTTDCPYGTNITIDSISTNCLTATGLYYLNYNVDGFPDRSIPPTVVNNLISKQVNGIETGEKVIFKATPVPNKSQNTDTACLTIYLTDMNNFYPVNCVR